MAGGVERVDAVVAEAERGRRHQVVTVRPGRGHHRGEVAIADGEGVGERVVEGDDGVVLVVERALTVRVVVDHEVVVGAVVPVLVHVVPAVVDAEAEAVVGVRGDGAAHAVRVGPVRGRDVDLIGVVEPGAALGEVAAVVVPLGHQPAEVVIEGAVLLHDHQHVIDGDVPADRHLHAQRLGRPGAGLKGARFALRRQLGFGLGARDVRRAERARVGAGVRARVGAGVGARVGARVGRGRARASCEPEGGRERGTEARRKHEREYRGGSPGLPRSAA